MNPPDLSKLEQAIRKAVRMRSDGAAVALSGGVDSALVACLAGKECVAVGLTGSHDLRHAGRAAELLGLSLNRVQIDPPRIEEALKSVLPAISDRDPVNASIAATLCFVSEWAADHGYRRILAGQGADELFAGYSRYLQSRDMAADLERDFLDLPRQIARDRAVAALHGTAFCLPYLDSEVVAAARAIPVEVLIKDGIRKWPLRLVAERHMPAEIAWHEKKAMQYGSGVMREMERLAAKRGYKRAIQKYLETLSAASQ